MSHVIRLKDEHGNWIPVPTIKGDAGRGIVSIARTSGTGAPGTADTYTITYTDDTTSTYQVRNGADGSGAGDMTKAVYDANGNGIVDNAEKLGGELPEHYAEADHSHGLISNDGKIGTTADLPMFTGTGGAVGTKTVAAARNLLGLGNTSGALPVANGGTGATSAAAALTNLGAAPAAITLTKTLTATGWENQEQAITDAAILANAPGDLRIAQSATDAEAEAWGKALPRVVAQTAGSITVRAAGEVPTINIPVMLEVRG